MSEPLSVVAALAAIAGLYVVLPYASFIFFAWRRARFLPCPVGCNELVQVDALRAAASAALRGEPSLRVRACSAWPIREDCAQGCLAAVR